MTLLYSTLAAILALGLPPARLSDLVSVARQTGESPALLAVVLWEESRGQVGAVGYCGRWEVLDGALTCRQALTCRSDCQRPEVWLNRLDVGLWQLRAVSGHVGGQRVRGWSWGRWLRQRGHDFRDVDLLDVERGNWAMVQVVNNLKSEKPKKCKSKYPITDGSWLSYYAAGPGGLKGCGVREKRLDKSKAIKGGE